MSINFNTNPYYDDFDETKNFYRFLFKPGYAVQARELTQLQTALQKQVDRFGKHIFKEGSLVLGGQFVLDTNVDTIRLTDAVTNTDLSTLVGKIIIGQTSGIRAYVSAVAYKDEWDETEDILMINYISSGVSSNTFVGSESLKYEVYVDNVLTGLENVSQTVKSSNATGKGSLASIQEGVVFTRGYFVSFVSQRIVISPTSQTPTGKVGFTSTEEIINPNQDASLLDPALGSYNYSAPGADRLKVSATLTLLGIDDDTTVPEFTTLFLIRDGQMIEKYQRSQYAQIYEEFAKRTYDESGDYVVQGLGVRVREHLDTGANDGYLKIADGGDVNKLALGIAPGLAYVKGYEVNNLVTKYLPIDKSITTKSVQDESLTARNGNYIEVTQIVGAPLTDIAQTVNLYDKAETRRSNTQLTSQSTPSGNTIGTAKVKAFEYNSEDNYNVYLFDIQMTGSNTFSNVLAVGNTTAPGFFADLVSSTIQDPTQALMLYGLGSNYVKNVRSDGAGTTDLNFTFTDRQNIVIDTTGIFQVTTNETHAYSPGLLSDTEKHSLVLYVTELSNTQLTGTVNVSTSSNVVTGLGTTFTNLNVNDTISVNGTTGSHVIKSITNNVSLIVRTNGGFSSTVNGANFNKIYNIGDIIYLTQKGSTGVERDVTASTGVLDFDLKETFTNEIDAVLFYNASKTDVNQIDKRLRPGRYVQINVNALSSNTNPVNLGFSDLYQIRQIRQKTNSTFSSNTEGTLVTDNFIIDNGQRDDFYDHARIIPKAELQANTWLLVELDYFEPVTTGSPGSGYFSVESYPIDDTVERANNIFTYEIPIYKSTYNGQSYNLRNYLDFRPVKTNSATDTGDWGSVGAATVNPGTSSSFNNNFIIPIPASQILCDYFYYLARRDMVVSDINGTFSVISGVPDIAPVSPSVPDIYMGIANLYIPPYPSLATTYARILNKPREGVAVKKITNTRYTMRDIGTLKQRIENLEYYNALTLLEKNTTDLLIPDENGNDRFKNGFFVDGFIDHSLGATYNKDYNIAVDKAENLIRPVYEMESLTFDYDQISSTNITKTGNLFSLPYTETVLLEQARVTTTRNIEQSVYRFIGRIELLPDSDVWMDETTVDTTVDTGSELPANNLITSTYGAWADVHTGSTIYNVYSRRAGDHTLDSDNRLIGTFSTYEQALAALGGLSSNFAGKTITNQRGFIETVTGSTEQTRLVLSSGMTTDSQLQQAGSFVTNTSIIPYIRPQTIDVVVRGLKANTTYYTWFDGENMTNFVTPRILQETDDANPLPELYGAEGSTWKTNSYGLLVGKLRLPDTKRFQVGSKEVIVTDNPTNSVDATSFAKSYFFASGIHVERTNATFSTRTIQEINETNYETRIVPGVRTVEETGWSCMAYSFKVEVPKEEPGVFLTSVDVFVKQVHPTLGVWFEIREMSTDGGVSRTQVPYSEVWYKSSEITTTADGTTPHNVQFPSPVFLKNNTQYAFVIHTEGVNPDTYFWISRLGETDIITNTPVTGRKLTGTLYTTNNNLNWDIVPDVDLKVKFYRAAFNTAVTGSAIFGNKPYEFLTLANTSANFNVAGETIQSSQILTLADVSNTIYVGNTITQGSNTANVIAIDGSTYYTNGFLFVTGSFTANAGATTGNITAISVGTGKVVKYDSNKQRMILDTSNGKFFENSEIRGSISNKSGKINSINEFVFSTVNFKPRKLDFEKTNTTLEMRGRLLSTNTYAQYSTFTPDTTYEFPEQYTIKSRTTEVEDYSSANSILIRATFSSLSGFVSPILDLSTTHNVFIKNIVNNDSTNEDSASGGNLTNKYISKIVTLADGQDAEDLIVKIKAYRPPTTDVKVWMKIRNAEDGQEFNLRPWIEMTKEGNEAFSSLISKNDFIDYTFVVPTSMLGDPNNTGPIQYTASNGSLLVTFKQFSIKIGLLATNSSVVPRVGELRAIALQK